MTAMPPIPTEPSPAIVTYHDDSTARGWAMKRGDDYLFARNTGTWEAFLPLDPERYFSIEWLALAP